METVCQINIGQYLQVSHFSPPLPSTKQKIKWPAANKLYVDLDTILESANRGMLDQKTNTVTAITYKVAVDRFVMFCSVVCKARLSL